jgi:UDP-N-acetyl-D-mannosaminuronic acid dehydrogenase
VGGHCIAIDPWFLTEHSDNAFIIKTARTINDAMPGHVIDIARKMLNGHSSPTVTILGVAYKADVDDARETPARHIVNIAKSLGWKVKVHDYFVKDSEFKDLLSLEDSLKDSDCIILVTNHSEYANLDPQMARKHMKTLNLIDTRNHLNYHKWINAGFNVRLLGDGSRKR